MSQKRKQIELVCPECGQVYLKDKSEYSRNEKKGSPSYCSLSCSSKARLKRPEIKAKMLEYSTSEENKEHLKKMSGNQRDEFTPFRMLLKTSKQRNKENNLDLQYLKELWENQNGICPYSGVNLQLPEYSNSSKIPKTIRASLDRIDSSKGYIKGNVQYTSTLINFMKNDLSDQEITDFIKIIIENKK